MAALAGITIGVLVRGCGSSIVSVDGGSHDTGPIADRYSDAARSSETSGGSQDAAPQSTDSLSDASIPEDAAAPPIDAAVALPTPTIVQPDAAPTTRPPPDPTPPPRNVYKEQVAVARRALAKGNHSEALEAIDTALTERRNARGLTLQADILLDMGGQLDRALASVNEAVRRSPRFARAWLIKGQIHDMKRQDAEAKNAFRKYLEIKPDGEDADGIRLLLGE